MLRLEATLTNPPALRINSPTRHAAGLTDSRLLDHADHGNGELADLAELDVDLAHPHGLPEGIGNRLVRLPQPQSADLDGADLRDEHPALGKHHAHERLFHDAGVDQEFVPGPYQVVSVRQHLAKGLHADRHLGGLLPRLYGGLFLLLGGG